MKTRTNPNTLQLVERLADGSLRRTALDAALTLPARQGVQYALIDLATGAAPQGLVMKRQGVSLIIELDDASEPVEITQFY